MRLLSWLWWLFPFYLLLRQQTDALMFGYSDGSAPRHHRRRHSHLHRRADAEEGANRSAERSIDRFFADDPIVDQPSTGPKSAQQLGVPICESNEQCTHGGACLPSTDGNRYCLCSPSCPPNVPVQCVTGRRDAQGQCLTMGADYRKKYDIQEPTCHKDLCVCPPSFEPQKVIRQEQQGFSVLLPMKCDKRELKVLGVASPSDSVYKGTDADLYCCINMDPRGVVASDGVDFVQNGTIIREPTSTPYEQIDDPSNDPSALAFQPFKCWGLHIKNVQFSDSGQYVCQVKSIYDTKMSANATIPFVVKAPRTVQNLSVKVNATTAEISWERQEGPMLKIDMKLMRRTDNAEVKNVKNAKPPLVFDRLKPATPYTLFTTVIDGQSEPAFSTEQFTTAESAPGPPSLVDIRRFHMGDKVDCEFEWKPPKTPNGRIVKYLATLRGDVRYVAPGGALAGPDYPSADTRGCANYKSDDADAFIPSSIANDFFSCRYTFLKPNRNYTATIIAQNGAGESQKVAFSKQCITDYGQPDRIEKPVTAPTKNSTAFPLKFGAEPEQTNGPIACYYLAVVPMMANASISQLPSPGALAFDTFAKTLDNNKNFAMNSGRYFAYIAESYSELPKETVVGDGNSSAGVEPCNTWYLSRNKPEDPALKPGMKYTGFLIVRVDRDVTLMQELRTDGFFARKRRRRQTHISSDPAYGFSEYFDAVYLLPIEAIDGFQGETTSWGAFVLLLLGMLVILLLVASGLMYFLHTRGVIKDFCPRKKPGHVPMTKHTGFQPINVDDLPNEYIIRHRDSDFLFTTEFDALPHYNNFDTTASERRENTRKNRYNDIKAFDITRVKLKGDAGDDYINANFIQGYKGKKTFIAAQGPLDQTVGDFWRMIWEHKVQIVVMVSNLFEKYRVQCSKYWPDEEAVTYENMEVRPVEATYYADYAVRVFELRRPSGVANGNGSLDHHGSAQQQQRQSHIYDSVAGAMAADRTSSRLSAETEFGGRTPDVRTVVQYHYTGWNDYRAPECTTGLLRFLCKLRRLEEFNDSPVVVHCSAGVGRTGTFIAIDGVLDQCIEEGKADVFGFVSTLRRQRNFMVQSLEQYVFVYKALAEWYLFGDTDIEVEKIHEHVARLKDPVVTYKLNGSASSSPGLNHVSTVVKSPRSSRSSASSRSLTTGLEAEFKKLDRSLENGRTSEFAKKDENIMKNRFENVVPFDRNRVILGPMVGHADASYINASVVKGYFYPYILAQDPVNSLTCFDFWRMVSEQNSTSIVMLSCEDDFSLEEKYWPDDMARGKAYGQQPDVAVQLASEEHNPTYTTRKFTMCSSKDKELREVVQFSYHDWPSDSPVPRSTGTLLELIGRVLQRQSFLPDSGPIILHCRDGSGRSGLYCCVSLLLERLKAESRVDVFQTVKSLQAQRPMLLNCLEQYSFCYQSVLDYLESFR